MHSPNSSALGDVNTSLALAILSVPPGSRVLDLGSERPAIASVLAERQCRVVSVTADERPMIAATPHAERTILGHADDRHTRAQLEGETFDVVLLLGVLAHVRNAVSVAAWARALLRPAGRIVASFENANHLLHRLRLLNGELDDDAAPDAPARRSFDRQRAEAVLSQAGLDVLERLRVTSPHPHLNAGQTSSGWPSEIIERLLQDPEVLTQEFVFVASSSPAPHSSELSLAEQLQLRVHALETESEQLRQERTRLRAAAERVDVSTRAVTMELEDMRLRVGDLETNLSQRMDELHLRSQDIRQLQTDVSVREGFIAQMRAQLVAERTTMTAIRGELQQALGQTPLLSIQIQTARAEAVAADQAMSTLREERDTALRHAEASHAQQQSTLDELGRIKAELTALHSYSNAAGFRLVNQVSLLLRKYGRVYALLRSLVRFFARLIRK